MERCEGSRHHCTGTLFLTSRCFLIQSPAHNGQLYPSQGGDNAGRTRGFDAGQVHLRVDFPAYSKKRSQGCNEFPFLSVERGTHLRILLCDGPNEGQCYSTNNYQNVIIVGPSEKREVSESSV